MYSDCSSAISSTQWLFVVEGILLFYGLALLSKDNIEVLAWIWVGFGWVVFILTVNNIHSKRHAASNINT
jgi:hypothetical protein